MDRIQSFLNRLILAVAVSAALATATGLWVGLFIAFRNGYTQLEDFRTGYLLLWGVGAALVAMILSRMMIFSSVHRITRILDVSRRFVAGDLRARICDHHADEIGVLARRFDNMADTLEHNLIVLRELAENNAELAQQVEQAATQAERVRISRDLHDAIAQRLFSLSAGASSLPTLIERDHDSGIEQARLIAEIAEHTLLDLRSLLAELRPSRLLQMGLVDAIKMFCQEWQNIHQVRVECEIVVAEALSAEIEDVLYRVVQESLHNIAKHTNASSVSVTIVRGQKEVILSITDNGQGFDLKEIEQDAGKFGLLGIRERARHLGGSMTVESDTAIGSTVRVQLPLFEGGEK